MSLKALAVEERPRERLSLYGVTTLSNTELLAILIGRGVRNSNALDVAKDVLSNFRLRDLNKVDYNELEQIRGVGFTKACNIIAAVELGKRAQRFTNKPKMEILTPKDSFNQVRDEMLLEKQEMFIVLFLNVRNGLVKKKVMFKGTIDQQLVGIKEIVSEAVKVGASKVVFAHNHPSGELDPSEQDIKVTKKMKKSLKEMDIELVDHLIIGDNNYLSLRSRKLL